MSRTLFPRRRDRDRASAARWPSAGFRGACLLVAGLVTVCLALRAPSARALGDEGADGRFERRESFHFTLFQDVDLDERSGLRGSRQFEQNVLDALESAYDRLDRLLGLHPERKLPVTLWDPALFDARFAGLFRFPAAGFYGGSIHVRAGAQVDEALVRVLHHELVHAALDAEAPGRVLPAWLNEGLAEWFEARAAGLRSLSSGEQAALVGIARRGELPMLGSLSGPTLAGLEPRRAAIAYLASRAFVGWLAERAGERGLAELVRAVVGPTTVERAVRRVYRSELAALEAAFRSGLGAR